VANAGTGGGPLMENPPSIGQAFAAILLAFNLQEKVISRVCSEITLTGGGGEELEGKHAECVKGALTVRYSYCGMRSFALCFAASP
jgi:hypothetical protein